jgi:hypothetical protein
MTSLSCGAVQTSAADAGADTVETAAVPATSTDEIAIGNARLGRR